MDALSLLQPRYSSAARVMSKSLQADKSPGGPESEKTLEAGDSIRQRQRRWAGIQKCLYFQARPGQSCRIRGRRGDFGEMVDVLVQGRQMRCLGAESVTAHGGHQVAISMPLKQILLRNPHKEMQAVKHAIGLPTSSCSHPDSAQACFWAALSWAPKQAVLRWSKQNRIQVGR